MSDDTHTDDWTQEIDELHVFFEQWLTGVLPDSDDAFSRVEAALADRFTMVLPSGKVLERGPLLAGLRGGHGTREAFTIRIRDPRLRHHSESLTVATYEEWQRTDTSDRGRISTVVFARRTDAPNGLEWVHVHETWIEGAPEAGSP